MYGDLQINSFISMCKTSQLVSEKTFEATNSAIRLVKYVIGTYIGFGVVSKLLPFALAIVAGVKKGVKGFSKMTRRSKAFEIQGDALSLKRFNALLLFVSGLVVAVPMITIAIFFYQVGTLSLFFIFVFLPLSLSITLPITLPITPDVLVILFAILFAILSDRDPTSNKLFLWQNVHSTLGCNHNFLFQAYAEQYFVLVVLAIEIWAIGQAFKGFLSSMMNLAITCLAGVLGVAGMICWIVYDENTLFLGEYLVQIAGEYQWTASVLKVVEKFFSFGFNYYFSQVVTTVLIARLSASMFAHGATGPMFYHAMNDDGVMEHIPSNLSALDVFSMAARTKAHDEFVAKGNGGGVGGGGGGGGEIELNIIWM